MTEPHPHPDLELASTDSLIVELNRRFDQALFVGNAEVSAGLHGMTFYWHGGKVPCIGLAEYASRRLYEIEREAMETFSEIIDDDLEDDDESGEGVPCE